MLDLDSKKERYLRDPLPTRLGGLAANLARIGTISINPANRTAVDDILRESKFFIEWTALEFSPDLTTDLIGLQREIAARHRKWQLDANDENCRHEISQWAKLNSQVIFERFKQLSSL